MFAHQMDPKELFSYGKNLLGLPSKSFKLYQPIDLFNQRAVDKVKPQRLRKYFASAW